MIRILLVDDHTMVREALRTVLEQDLGGATDTVVFEACGAESRVLVTLDLDFADIRRQGISESPGILWFA